MLRKIMLIAKRDYIAAVRTKAFLIGLIAGPLLMSGGFLGLAVMKHSPDTQAKRIAIVDRTGVSAQAVVEELQQENARDLYDKATGAQIMPRYEFKIVPADLSHAVTQRLALSDQVRSKKLFAFVEIGEHALAPRKKPLPNERNSSISWYSNEGGFEQLNWFSNPLNQGMRRVRLAQIGITAERSETALKPVNVESLNLVVKDPASGRIIALGKKGELQELLAPFVLAMLLFFIALTAAAPMLSAVAEDKMQRVFEMLLAAATPFEIMAGKTTAAVGIALTSAAFYIVAAVALLEGFAVIGLAPLELLPWFLVYLLAEVVILTTISAALGAACSSPQDGEKLKPLIFLPVMVPMFLMLPAIQQPNSLIMTLLSFVPVFTPFLMLMRQAAPGGIPAWQPWVGLAAVVVASVAIAWLASRVFRLAILMQGKMPALSQLVKWGLRG